MARRIVVVGNNCQVAVLGGCLGFLAPEAQVAAVEPATFAQFDASPQRLLEAVAEADLTVGMPFERGALGDLVPARIAQAARTYVPIPTIVFPAFHPDIVYIGHKGGLFGSPMGDYHSALIVYGFARGFSVDEIVSLFRADVFARLGYLDGWFAARDSLLAMSRTHGFDLDRLFAGWMRRGCFMHTINHPKLFVLGDLAREALTRAGIPARAATCEDYLPDPLSGSIWPVYPEIAARIGVTGSTTFKPPLGGLNFLVDAGRCIDLRAMVESSLAIYAHTPKIAQHCERVGGWLDNGEIRDALQPLAR
ncbi:WcbI family polysaccharide biosynthesis putative acetyltransferase [Methylobacterium sp. B4]|uniref:WcbI family polysaccharide biosynthesis putative acetyltransferase n=1 Tax=Methylobacterium sp. B4 TaxID=1938755 RepID=UPI000D751E50|nr:WcbI family polysaccharide biosynthesis putative acetyltransferase [Methylobacterium sp. B4]